MEAQSQDSVPPAPGWIVRIASFLSAGSLRRTLSSKSESSFSSLFFSPASSSPPPSSSSASISPWRYSHLSITSLSSFISFKTFCACSLSFQKEGEDASSSREESFSFFFSISKIPPEVLYPFFKRSIHLSSSSFVLTIPLNLR